MHRGITKDTPAFSIDSTNLDAWRFELKTSQSMTYGTKVSAMLARQAQNYYRYTVTVFFNICSVYFNSNTFSKWTIFRYLWWLEQFVRERQHFTRMHISKFVRDKRRPVESNCGFLGSIFISFCLFFNVFLKYILCIFLNVAVFKIINLFLTQYKYKAW